VIMANATRTTSNRDTTRDIVGFTHVFHLIGHPAYTLEG
jgi:hypothetical protein